MGRAHIHGALACLLLVLPVRAETPADPLRLVPAEADLILQVPHPRRLIDAVVNLDLAQQVQTFSAFGEIKESTNIRRFRQLVVYVEKQLGAPWPTLVERLTGGGAVAALKYGGPSAPKMLVIQSTDDELLSRFVKLGLDVLGQELARQESKDKIQRGRHRDVETIRVGNDLHLACFGSSLVVSNVGDVVQRAIDLHLDGPAKSLLAKGGPLAARKLLPDQPLAMLWASLEAYHKTPDSRDPPQLVLFGGWPDVARRAPFVAAGLYAEEGGFRTAVRLPAGRQALSDKVAFHAPAEGQSGALPLLTPPETVASFSYFFDLAKFWNDRAKIVGAKAASDMEKFDKDTRKFLPGTQFSELLKQTGPRQRVVVAKLRDSGYHAKLDRPIPAFAWIVELRDPEKFGKSIEPILRGAALLYSTQVKLKMIEEERGGSKIIGYRFDESAPQKNDPDGLRFYYSPSFARVGNQFVASSTIDLCRKVIDELGKPPGKPTAHAFCWEVNGAGGAAMLQSQEDQIIAQTILDRALPIEASKKEVKTFLDLVRRLGVLHLESEYAANDYRLDVRWIPAR
jgi:hypothetical protein